MASQKRELHRATRLGLKIWRQREFKKLAKTGRVCVDIVQNLIYMYVHSLD